MGGRQTIKKGIWHIGGKYKNQKDKKEAQYHLDF